jgi:hypothetical protein
MLLKLAKIVTCLVILIMTMEWFGAAITACPVDSHQKVSIHSKVAKSFFASILVQTAEEETEKSEEERDRFIGVELIDLTRVARLLSISHSPQVHIKPYEQHYDVRPSLFTLHCVFII